MQACREIVAPKRPPLPKADASLPPPHGLLVVVGDEGSPYKVCSALALRSKSLFAPESVGSIISSALGDMPRGAMPVASEAKFLNMRTDVMQAKVQDLAAASYFGQRAWCSSLLAYGRVLVEKDVLLPIWALRYTLGDETPLVMRAKDLEIEDTAPPSLPVLLGVDVNDVSDEDEVEEKGVRKVIQTEAELAALFWHNSAERYIEWRIPLPCHLGVGDRGTGEVLLSSLHDQLEIPGYDDFCSLFPWRDEASTRDRARSNKKCLRGLSNELPDEVPTLDLPCDSHIVSTSQGRGFAPIADIVSGTISCSLLQRIGGAPGQFRTACVDVLFQSVTIVDAPPPPDSDPRIVRRDALCKLLLPKNKKGVQRSACLKQLENSNTESDQVFYVHIYNIACILFYLDTSTGPI